MDVDAGGIAVQTHIDLKFADGEYRFALGLVQIDELQSKAGVGIGALYARVLQGRMPENPAIGHPAYAGFFLADLRETIRQGLIGGGQGRVDGADVTVSPLRANELVDRYLAPLPLAEQWNLAAAVLFAVVEGYEPKEGEGEPPPVDDEKKNPTRKAGSTTPAH